MSLESNKQLVKMYIDQIWNNRKVEDLDLFVHEAYYDHSFVPGLPRNKEGLKMWIEKTSAAFQHETITESILAEEDLVTIRITFKVKHTGKWRGIEATGRETEAKGFRQFRVKQNKIVEHWALLDGESLQATLTEVPQGCELPHTLTA